VQVGARILVKLTRTFCSAVHEMCHALVPPRRACTPRLYFLAVGRAS
jgi:hypothetical protein